MGELLVEAGGDVWRDGVADDVLDELSLSVEDDVAQLSEVVYHCFGLIVLQEEDLSSEALEDSISSKELIENRVENPMEGAL